MCAGSARALARYSQTKCGCSLPQSPWNIPRAAHQHKSFGGTVCCSGWMVGAWLSCVTFVAPSPELLFPWVQISMYTMYEIVDKDSPGPCPTPKGGTWAGHHPQCFSGRVHRDRWLRAASPKHICVPSPVPEPGRHSGCTRRTAEADGPPPGPAAILQGWHPGPGHGTPYPHCLGGGDHNHHVSDSMRKTGARLLGPTSRVPWKYSWERTIALNQSAGPSRSLNQAWRTQALSPIRVGPTKATTWSPEVSSMTVVRWLFVPSYSRQNARAWTGMKAASTLWLVTIEKVVTGWAANPRCTAGAEEVLLCI